MEVPGGEEAQGRAGRGGPGGIKGGGESLEARDDVGANRTGLLGAV